VYGWFERLDTGLYGLSAHGRADLALYPELTAHYLQALKGRKAASRGGREARKGKTGKAGRAEN
jgi:hypothetical protein